MNARVFLVVLMSAMFMGVWTSDQNAMNEAIARRNRIHSSVNRIAADCLPMESHQDKAAPVNAADVQEETQPDDESAAAVVPTIETIQTDFQASLIMAVSVPVLVSVDAEHVDAKSVDVESLENHSVSVVEISGESLASIQDILSTDEVEAAVVTEETSEANEESPSAVEAPSAVESEECIESETETSPLLTEQTEPLATSAGMVALPLTAAGNCIPLPKNLASGTWQVMAQSGELFRITVDRNANTLSSDVLSRSVDLFEESFCITVTPEGDRWCFVRSFVDAPMTNAKVTTQFFAPIQE